MSHNEQVKHWFDFPSSLLLVAVMLTAATRLVATGWTRHLDIVQTIAVLSVVIGIALGASQFSTKVSLLLGAMYGMFLIPWQLTTILNNEIATLEKMTILFNRSEIILRQLWKNEVVYDSLIFLILMTILFFIAGAAAGFVLTRKGNPWMAIIPTGLILFTIHNFDLESLRKSWYLAFFMFLSLILIARMTFLKKEATWKTIKTAVPAQMGFEFIRFTVLAILGIVLLVWTAPALARTLPTAEKAWQPVQNLWEITRDSFDNAFASLQSSAGIIGNFYGRSASLGTGTPLSDQHVLSVRSNGGIPEGVRLYWRARVYDAYENGRWASNQNSSFPYRPDEQELLTPRYSNRLIHSFEFIGSSSLKTLYTPPQPIWLSRKAVAEAIKNPDGTYDLTTFRASPDLEPGQGYIVQSSLSYLSVEELRNAGEEYPDWILDRYLQLPDTITPRTRELALDITRGLETPYDKAEAITRYLRENIAYSDTVPIQPNGTEAVDWILFDLKEGFCNYYATAEIVLLRSIGIPARWAIGYSTGEQVSDGEYIVRQRNAHSWPEIFFPEYGWVEFEPTAAQPVLERVMIKPEFFENGIGEQPEEFIDPEPGSLNDEIPNFSGQFDLPQSSNDKLPFIQISVILISSLAGIALIYLAIRVQSRINYAAVPLRIERSFKKAGINPPKFLRNWTNTLRLSPVSRAYIEINHALSRIQKASFAALTPAERAKLLGRLLPSTAASAENLASEYQQEHYGEIDTESPASLENARIIKNASRKAFFYLQLDRFPQRKGKLKHPFSEPE
jgi:transglutaminase-like putative cysteine protease